MRLDIAIADPRLRRRCEAFREAVRAWGEPNAEKVFLRIAQIRAAATLADLFTVSGARCHALRKDRRGQFAVDLKQPYRLIFEPVDPLPAEARDGQPDYTLVTAVRLLEVTDYHD